MYLIDNLIYLQVVAKFDFVYTMYINIFTLFTLTLLTRLLDIVLYESGYCLRWGRYKPKV